MFWDLKPKAAERFLAASRSLATANAAALATVAVSITGAEHVGPMMEALQWPACIFICGLSLSLFPLQMDALIASFDKVGGDGPALGPFRQSRLMKMCAIFCELSQWASFVAFLAGLAAAVFASTILVKMDREPVPAVALKTLPK